jgi:hypothetical protein
VRPYLEKTLHKKKENTNHNIIFHKIENEYFPVHFMKLILPQRRKKKDKTVQNVQIKTFYKYRCKNSFKSINKWIKVVYKSITHYAQMKYFPGMQGWFNIQK